MGLNFNPQPVNFKYYDVNNTLKISPLPGQTLRFRDIGVLKFGDSSQEPNVCNAASTFSYKMTQMYPFSEPTGITFTLTSKSGSKFVSDLVATFQLIDNTGTIYINITTAEDFNGTAGASVFKVPGVLDLPGYANYSGKVTKDISDFIYFNYDPFNYVIHQEKNRDKVVYQSDANKLYMSKYFVMDSGSFSMNSATNYPLMGMGERAGSIFYQNQ